MNYGNLAEPYEYGIPEGSINFIRWEAENEPENFAQRMAERDAQQQAMSEQINALTPSSSTPALVSSETAEDTLKGMRRLNFLSRLPGGYDYGAGSARRNADYKGIGESMSGIYALNRPTIGLDIWNVVTTGVKAGVKEYQAQPNKIKLPITGPKFNLPTVPSWLSQTAKAISQPAKIIGKNIVTAAQKDRAQAQARAAAQGTSLPPEIIPEPAAPSIPWGKLALGGGVIAAVLIARRSR